MPVYRVWFPWRPEEDVESPETKVTDSRELSCGYWKSNQGPLQPLSHLFILKVMKTTPLFLKDTSASQVLSSLDYSVLDELMRSLKVRPETGPTASQIHITSRHAALRFDPHKHLCHFEGDFKCCLGATGQLQH